jgi:2-dehydropantoate 2-reductase
MLTTDSSGGAVNAAEEQPPGAWRVAVVGPGGVGGLIAGVLARAGHPVRIVARPDTAEALTARGLTVQSRQFGDFHVPVVAAPRLTGPVDACIVAVKATALPAALDAVPAGALGDGLVLPLLNGVEHMALLRERYPAEQIVAGTIRVESTRVETGRIVHASPYAWIELASRTAPRERVEALAGRLSEAGLDVAVRDDETALLWAKLALLAPLALLTTHAAAPAGTVRERRRADLEAVVGEVAAVAGAAGAPVDPEPIMERLDQLPPAMKSSMQRDVEAGRPTELDAIGGAVLRAARRHGVATPVTARLVADLTPR